MLDLYSKGELDASQIPELGTLMQLVLNGSNGEEIDGEDE